jgi:Glycosyl transferase family 2
MGAGRRLGGDPKCGNVIFCFAWNHLRALTFKGGIVRPVRFPDSHAEVGFHGSFAMTSAAIIVPTTGAPEVRMAIASTLAQTHPQVELRVVVDGPEFEARFRGAIIGMDLHGAKISVLPENVGRGGFNGHRIYAAFSHLVNADYVLFLDEDNWFDPHHVASMIETIETGNLDWCFSLRKVRSKSGVFLLNDDCESLGKWDGWTNCRFVDTNAYCLRQSTAARVASLWNGRRGQDRVFFSGLTHYFPTFECTGLYTVNYRLGGNPGSAKLEFFEKGNAEMRRRYPHGFPWEVDTAIISK